ncbi:hypothetical protein HZY91_07770 [Facklamia sp. DSM 111018]|uniref:Uncharacterized protein n=1 Tax=Facklamia lactis TaxID=2749967 RepID=A0ABS0LU14_9LACT|nr:hypothetical protein [Facklamia lactis]MBG9980843.1 hypothetical protein [Facklamia lactis]MBG9986794.1 hypothetical protein [Facklamia lactis]
MVNQNDFNSTIEKEITKQLQEIDRHVDRTGWPLLIVGVSIFFLLVYLFITVFSIPTSEEYHGSQAAITERIDSLEQRIDELESEIESLK